MKGFKKSVAWLRDKANPILAPSEGNIFGSTICMNPWIMVKDSEYQMYFGADDGSGRRRICLAAAADNTVGWDRKGYVFDNGPEGSFDHAWCVLPNIVQLEENLWHMYYTANKGSGSGLSQFPGIGLAISDDGKTWRKYGDKPVLAPSGVEGEPDCVGMAGGSVIKVDQPNGEYEIRYYYTGCPTMGDDYFLDQQKVCCLALSRDGIEWEKKGVVLVRNPEHDYENVAVAGPVVMVDDGLYRMWYSSIGTRWGYYSICYAESEDGITWYRGENYGDNLQLGPSLGPLGTGWKDLSWDCQMVEYPSVIKEGHNLRLFYTGNGYGKGGIGTAVSAPLRVMPQNARILEARIISHKDGVSWLFGIAECMIYNDTILFDASKMQIKWHGPDPDCSIWCEWVIAEENQMVDELFNEICCRLILTHTADGIDIRFTMVNRSQKELKNILLKLSVSGQVQEITRKDDEGNKTITVEWENLQHDMSSCHIDEVKYSEVLFGNLKKGETRTMKGRIRQVIVCMI